MMKKLIVAESAGFCFGVRRSVEMAETLLQKGPCVSFGMLIHNEDVIRKLAAQGMRTVEDISEVMPGERVLIRAHGVPPETMNRLREKGALISDATCPKVMFIHRIVEKASEEGRFVLIIGMRSHTRRKLPNGCRNIRSQEICRLPLLSRPHRLKKISNNVPIS